MSECPAWCVFVGEHTHSSGTPLRDLTPSEKKIAQSQIIQSLYAKRAMFSKAVSEYKDRKAGR